MRLVAAYALVLAFPLVACGGRVDLPSETAGGDAGTDGAPSTDSEVPSTDGGDDATPVPDGGPPIDGGAPSEVTCDRLVKALCGDAAAACCKTKGFSHDAEACTNAISYWCNFKIEAVSDGVLTYDGTQLEACASAYQGAMTSCDLHWLEWAKSNVACAHLFNGKKPPGAACSGELDCNSAPGFSAYCDTTTKRCRSYGVVGAGSPCNYYGSTIRYCDFGLYCDVSATTPTCKPAKALGEACDGVDDFTCGYDRTCKDGKCAPGLPGGSDCTHDLECTSWSCQAGKCTVTDNSLATASLCSGS